MRRSYNDRGGYGGGAGGGGGYGGGRGGYGGGGYEDDGGERGPNMDEPPCSRLFIIGGKTLTEKEFREAFSEYGEVERVDVKREKGISYIKFSKTSEAAEALENLNGKTIGTDPRPLKIVIASSRSQQNNTNKHDITALRLYLIIPKSMTETALRAQFEQFGPLEYVSVVKDKVTDTSRGFGYVKFFQFSHAAKAFEGCDPSYKPKFADPRPSLEDRRAHYAGSIGGSEYSSGGGRQGAREMNFETTVSNPTNTPKLQIMVNPILTQEKLWKLFDIVPGLQHCEIHSGDATGERAYGSVVYNTPKAASYAMEKLHGFDYPLGSRVMIKFEEAAYGGGAGAYGAGAGGYGAAAGMPSDVKSLVATIQHATQMLSASGYVAPDALGAMNNVMGGMKETPVDPSMCSPFLAANLPAGPVPLASIGSNCERRLFFVCKDCPELPPPHILTDLFSRFGNLIDAYLMKGKNCGYAKYASAESADHAVKVLNEQTLCRSFFKVMIADESSNKRPRVD